MLSQESKFLSSISQEWTVDKSKFSKYEWIKYEEGLKKLDHFSQLKAFTDNMENFLWELRTLYIEIQRESTTPNFCNRRDVFFCGF